MDGRTLVHDSCPCCDVEFGYEDVSLVGIERWRQRWLDGGAQWRRRADRPEDWDLERQFAQLPERVR